MAWAAWACSTMYGTVGPQIPLAGTCTVSQPLNGIEDWTLDVPADWFARVGAKWWQCDSASVVIAHTCDVLPGWQAVAMGPVRVPPKPDNRMKPSVYTLAGKGLRDLLTQRLATTDVMPKDFGDLWTYERTSLLYTGMSLGTIQEELCKVATSRANGALPISFDAQLREDNLPESTDHDRTYPFFNVSNNGVDKLLTDLSDVDGGPDFMLRPVLTAPDQGQWTVSCVAVHGMNNSPWIPQDRQLVWDATAMDGVVTAMDVTPDGRTRCNRVWAVGSGTDAATLIQIAQDDAALQSGQPLMEAVSSYTSITSNAPLMAHAKADLNPGTDPRPDISVTVRADAEGAAIGTWHVGDRVRLIAGDALDFPAGRDADGAHLMTIVKADFDLASELVKVGLRED